MELNLDPETSTWFGYQHDFHEQKLGHIKHPDHKYTLPQVQDWITGSSTLINNTYENALKKTVPEDKCTENIIRWNKDNAKRMVDIVSNNNYNWIWRTYTNDIYLEFRKFIGERTRKNIEKTIIGVDINKDTLSITLEITDKFSDVNRQRAIDFFVNKLKAADVVYRII
jgi:hypothetical protein